MGWFDFLTKKSKPVFDTADAQANQMTGLGLPTPGPLDTVKQAGDMMNVVSGIKEIAEPGPASPEALGKTATSGVGLAVPFVADMISPGSGDMAGAAYDYAKDAVSPFLPGGTDGFVGSLIQRLGRFIGVYDDPAAAPGGESPAAQAQAPPAQAQAPPAHAQASAQATAPSAPAAAAGPTPEELERWREAYLRADRG